MRLSMRKQLLLALLTIMIIVSGVIIYIHNPAVFTANLNNRPFNAAVTGPVDNLLPGLLERDSERLVAGSIYEGLVSYNEKEDKIEGLIARKWKYSDEGKTITFYLRKDIKFTNGKKLTAADVKASWEKNLGRCKEWSDTGLFLPIEGANAMINGSRQDILGMQAIDEHTLEIKLTKPDGAFIYSLLNPVFWVMDAGATEPLPGTGPFCIKEIKPETISLVRNDNYYRGLPPLSAIEFHIYKDRTQALQTYKKGFIDYLADLPLSELKSMQSDPSYRDLLVSKPLLDVYWLGFNLGREPYNKTYLLRRALNYAIDREAISKQVFGGGYLPAKGVLPQGINGYNKNMTGYQYNPEKAGQLLTEAGYPHGQGLKPLTLTYNSDQGHKQVAEEVSRQLGNLGITVQLQENDWDYYKKQMYQRGMSFFRLEWQADYPDADNFLYSLFHSSKIGASNFTGYSNPQVDKLLDASRLEFRDKEARLKLLKRAEEIIIDDAPCLWLFQKRANGLVSGEVKNLNLNSMGLIDWFKVELVKPEAGAAAAPASKT